MTKKIIAVCSSANFYKEVVNVEAKLEKMGFEVIIPISATKMKATGKFDVSHRTWLNDPSDYHKKTSLIRAHLDEIEKSDAILVVNNEKHGIKNYIGGNVLMEMTLAFHQKKPIYLLNKIPVESSFLEEIIGMEPIVLDGDLGKIVVKAG
jgi:hypothetical protein